MNYLLDTCVLSEFSRLKPENKVVKWMDSLDDDSFFISAITIGEIHYGIERLPESHRKTELQAWVNRDLIDRFGERVVNIDHETMYVWGTLTAHLEKDGHPMGVMDSLIAACALKNNLILATRNIQDFQQL